VGQSSSVTRIFRPQGGQVYQTSQRLPFSLWIGGGAMPACYEIGGWENQRE
jgi:hypothetical protein